MSLPKMLQRYKSRIDSFYVDGDGLMFIGYKNGWKSYSDPLGCVHGDTAADMLEAISWVKSAVKCDCKECTE